MSDSAAIPAIVLVLLLGSAAAGSWLQSRLPERHRTRETTDAVRAAAAMIITFSALVLGLLVNSASGAFNQLDGRVRAYAVTLVELDQALREYGADADPLRQRLRAYTAAAIAWTWRDEPPPPGDHDPKHLPAATHPRGLENQELGEMLTGVELAARRLQPADPYHRQLAARILDTFDTLQERRWRLIQSAQIAISTPFLAVLVLWLAVVFACFGLTAPRNATARATVAFCALVLASAVFLLLEFDRPFTGFIAVSSAPFRDALLNMGS